MCQELFLLQSCRSCVTGGKSILALGNGVLSMQFRCHHTAGAARCHMHTLISYHTVRSSTLRVSAMIIRYINC